MLRLQSKDVEVNPVRKTLHPGFGANEDLARFGVDPTVKVAREMPNSLPSDYLEIFRGGYPGIPDRRFKHTKRSTVEYILELARVEDSNASVELGVTF